MNRGTRKPGAIAPTKKVASTEHSTPAPASVAAKSAALPKRAAKGPVATSAAASAHENDENDEEDNMILEEDHKAQKTVDVKYSPEIISSILADLEKQVQLKCQQIQKDADFMATSIKQAFHLELIKLPTQVKQMSLARFRSEFGDSLEAVTRGAIGGRGSTSAYSTITGGAAPSSAVKGSRASSRAAGVFQTPSHHRGGREPRMSVAQTPSSRKPREGEMLLSANGSPLGEFQTVVKAGRPGPKIEVPPTPGMFVPLQTGEIVDLENADISSMPQDVKLDALVKMQGMMANMAALMQKLKGEI